MRFPVNLAPPEVVTLVWWDVLGEDLQDDVGEKAVRWGGEGCGEGIAEAEVGSANSRTTWEPRRDSYVLCRGLRRA